MRGEVVTTESKEDKLGVKQKVSEEVLYACENEIYGTKHNIGNDTTPTKPDHPTKLYRNINGTNFIQNEIKYDLVNCSTFMDVSQINTILVSNIASVYALPFIVHSLCKGKVGKKDLGINIYITQPLHQIGKPLCLELYEATLRQNQDMEGDGLTMGQRYESESELYDVFESIKLEMWEEIYTEEMIDLAFDLCTVVNYNQEITQGVVALQPISSGHHLGSANWVMAHAGHRIGVVEQSSMLEFRYPLKMNQISLRNLDVMVVTSVVNLGYEKHNYVKNLQLLEHVLKDSLRNTYANSKLLMPMSPFLMQDLLDLFISNLNEQSKISIFSPSQSSVKQFSNINSDYLNKKKLQSKILKALDPFEYKNLKGEMSVFDWFKDYQHHNSEQGEWSGGEVVMATHSSLRLGDSLLWMELLNEKLLDGQKSERVNIVVTDPQYRSDLLFKPLGEMNRIKVHYLPLDPNPSMADMRGLVGSVMPKMVICPEEYGELSEVGVQVRTITHHEIVEVDLDALYEGEFEGKVGGMVADEMEFGVEGEQMRFVRTNPVFEGEEMVSVMGQPSVVQKAFMLLEEDEGDEVGASISDENTNLVINLPDAKSLTDKLEQLTSQLKVKGFTNLYLHTDLNPTTTTYLILLDSNFTQHSLTTHPRNVVQLKISLTDQVSMSDMDEGEGQRMEIGMRMAGSEDVEWFRKWSPEFSMYVAGLEAGEGSDLELDIKDHPQLFHQIADIVYTSLNLH